ncbi:MAG TPA: bifunctional pyr operon transcriptional regulator/uracil phosphoribosyltransferase PyrR [Candidatus Acidoferrales bacterium]|jgi:pyrimidine operon attenuation protein/uracil phosphoribosyltransferase|nr:bifunctional pyr operon transcriptional regulator/uracil phosphoribosyltransferase PyrR [Candidatus Acidoferrales bacterium]
MSELPISPTGRPQLLDAATMARIILRLAHEIAERHPGLDGVILLGVPTRGVPLAQRLASALASIGLQQPPAAALDPRNHRDDRPRVAGREVPALTAADGRPIQSIEGATVIVVDDVLFTGRTLRAALDALMDHGRPATVDVLTLIDRGHRELPLRATYVGKNVPTAVGDRVAVRLREIDGVDGAWLLRGSDS